MAYKRSNGKLQRRKIEPAVQTITVATPLADAGTTTTSYCDLSQMACLVNRRFYRQGLNWVVSGFKIFSTVTGAVTISKLPETWVMKNAWVKGMENWRKMIDESLEEGESLKGRFMDFKIYADAEHHDRGFDANLLPLVYDKPISVPATTVEAVPGEWVSSKYIIPDTTLGATGGIRTREIVATGANYPGASAATALDAVSLIEGYAASRALPYQVDPNTPTDSADTVSGTPENWLGALFNEGLRQSDEVIEDMTTENNKAPYPFEGMDPFTQDTVYPGGANQLSGMQVHDLCTITGTTVGGMTYAKGGTFGCGLIRIDHEVGGTGGNLLIQIDLVPGNHRGYLCEPMGA
jgi:hypothetical protein